MSRTTSDHFAAVVRNTPWRHYLVRHGGTVAVACVLASSLAANGCLASRTPFVTFRDAVVSPIGRVVESVSVERVTGEPVSLSFTGRRTVVYYLSPTCRFCDQNEPNVVTLARSLEGEYQVVALVSQDGANSVGGLAEYTADRGLPFDVFVLRNEEWRRAMFLHVTPTTVVVDAGAMVVRFWRGAYVDERQAAVEGFFRVTLPGLTQADR